MNEIIFSFLEAIPCRTRLDTMCLNFGLGRPILLSPALGIGMAKILKGDSAKPNPGSMGLWVLICLDDTKG